jgi:hypothetical protein
MKKYFFIIPVITLFLLLSSMNSKSPTEEIEKKILGVWKWEAIINSESNEKEDLSIVTNGLATEVKTEYKKDHTYIEYKNKLQGEEGYSKNKGQWKLEKKGSILNHNSKGKWRPSKIFKLTKDTLLIGMRGPIQLLMIKEK